MVALGMAAAARPALVLSAALQRAARGEFDVNRTP